jgi:hypothetical protein
MLEPSDSNQHAEYYWYRLAAVACEDSTTCWWLTRERCYRVPLGRRRRHQLPHRRHRHRLLPRRHRLLPRRRRPPRPPRRRQLRRRRRRRPEDHRQPSSWDPYR